MDQYGKGGGTREKVEEVAGREGGKAWTGSRRASKDPSIRPKMKSLLWFVTSLVALEMSLAEVHAIPKTSFVRDFVNFYRISRVCVISPDTNPWLSETLRQLIRFPGCFTSAPGVRKGASNPASGNATRPHPAPRFSCRGLRVMRLGTPSERELFKEIFIGEEIRQRWLLVSGSDFPQLLEPVYLPLSNMITIANFSSDGKVATLWESYQVSEHLEQRTQPVGRWVSIARPPHARTDTHAQFESATAGEKLAAEGVFSSHPLVAGLAIPKVVRVERRRLGVGALEAPVDDPPLRRRDLTGLHVRCTTVEYEPLVVLKHHLDGTVRVKGLFGKVFDALREITNFTSTCRRVRDGQWGVEVGGEWRGMVGEVVDGTADVAVAPLAITLERSAVAEFLLNVVASSYGIAMRRPSNEDYMWTVYTKQFERGVWGMMVTVALALGAALYVVSRWSKNECEAHLSESFFTVVGFLFGQGTTLGFHTVAGRTVMLTALLLQLISLAYYTSNMVSALTVGPSLPALNDLRDVHNDPAITFGFVKGTANTIDFRDSSNPLLQEVWRNIEEEDLSPTAPAGMERVREGDYALMLWELFFDMNYGHDCRVFMLPARYFSTYTSFALPRDSPLVPLMNKLILDIVSSGLLRKWWTELSYSTTDCSALEATPIELKTVLTPFLLLGLSALVSLGILAAERSLCQTRTPASLKKYSSVPKE
ncbi:putative glutamate receptor ionotropic, delta-1 isoform X2 [Penaeus vannamei]|uniref:Putative glutamate receptor ionotropic, delta-1 isoform X2 n=1 Tax=Penaeus vannamei TaxID=6689 RepID=A0A3R7MJX4_PENVA|nr:putative glutamate receptor ionotropic, delta-1 isoform X2 [Penaeus vannamei]